MNILMLGWELPPHNSGGLGVACYYMSKALAVQGADIDFIVPYKAVHDDVEFMRVHSATSLPPLYRDGMGAYDSRQYLIKEGIDEDTAGLRDIRSVQKAYVKFVEQFVVDREPAAIHAHDWLTMEAGMRAKDITGAPLIVHVHATEFDRAGGEYGNAIVHEIEQTALLMADRIIAVSDVTKQIIVNRYNIPADKVEIIHNALSTDNLEGFEYDFRTYRYLEAMKLEGYTVVSIVTRLTLQKGLVQFLEAAAKASEVYGKLIFLIAGDGDQRDELLALSAELGIADRVLFTGFVRGKQWRDAFNVADIFVMSSISEPFGLTALEAAYHDTAVILTKQSGVGEVVNSVLRYDFWDTDKLADQLVAIATSRALKTALQENIKHEYMRITWHTVAQKCMDLYKNTKLERAIA